MRKPIALSLLAVLVSAPLFGAKEMRLALRFTPKENVTANLPSTDTARPVRTIDVMALIDVRELSDRSLVGENRERKTPRPIKATTSVAEFATEVLQRCLSEWGVRLGAGDLVLRGEITNLLVTEDQTYSTASAIRFRLEDQTGMVVWEGIASGDAHQWGRSFSAENYNEQISDALKKTFASLVSNPGFQKAWAGEPSVAEGATVSPAEVKAKVLEMVQAGVGEAVLISYVRGLRISPPLTADEIIAWKRAGITDRVIEAAVAR
jgi:hypothetical protein